LQAEKHCSGNAVIALGDLVVSLCTSCNTKIVIGEAFTPFLSDASPDITFHIHYGHAPRLELGCPLFSSEANWVLYYAQEQFVISLQTQQLGLYQLVTLDPDLKRGDIYCIGELWQSERQMPILGYPLGEILFVNLLASGRGLLFHACGIDNTGQGILFSGTSGAGKSTLTRLWQNQMGVIVLSDDRVIMRKREGRFWIYGTPWHGDAKAVSPKAVPLERIFVIRHAAQNNARQLSPPQAAAALLVRSFPPFWDAEGMNYTLEFLDELTRTVPCYDLGFVPDESAIGFVQCIT